MTTERAFFILWVPCRRLASAGLVLVLLAGFAAGRRAMAVDYTWATATTGSWSLGSNWTPATAPGVATSGISPSTSWPVSNADTATIDATGSPYTVSVNGTAGYTIGSVTLNSANATLNASPTSASQQLRISGTANFTAGSILGTFDFMAPGASLTIDKNNVTVAGTTTYKFNRYDGIFAGDPSVPSGNYSQTFNAGNLSAGETLRITQSDAPYALFVRGFLSVTTANGFTNNGTIEIRNTGGYASTAFYTIQSGALTNNSLVSMSTVGSPTDGGGNHMGVIELRATITNEASGEIRLDRTNGATTDDGRILVGTSTSSHINRGLIRVVAGSGNYFVGTTLTNAGGTIRNSGTTAVLNARASFPATIDNAEGTIEARGSGTASTFTIQNALSTSTRSGDRLIAGTYLVTGGTASTTLSLSTFGGAGTITALGDNSTIFPLDVTLNGTTAAFTQLESGSGSLATIRASGRLNILGGKVFTAATSLSNAGTINVGAGSRLSLGSSGTGMLTVGFDGVLVGSGAVAGNLTGDGLIAPGNSPGILTVEGQITPTSLTGFAFELTGTGSPTWSNAGASVNDVLRLINADPFTSGLTSTNEVSIYFDVNSLAPDSVFLGGFFSDRTSGQLDFAADIGAPTYTYYVYGSGSGSAATYNGKNYYTLAQIDPSYSVAVSVTTVPTANFSGGSVTNGQVTQFVIVPEPASLALAGVGIAAAAYAIRRRQQA